MPKQSYWSDEEIQILKDCVAAGMSTPEIHELLPNRKQLSIYYKMTQMKLRPVKHHGARPRWSDEEKELLRQCYLNNIPVDEIVTQLKETFGTNRSWGTVRQQIFQMGLSRDARKTRLVHKYGSEILSSGATAEEIISVLNRNARQVKEAKKAEIAETKQNILNQVLLAVANGMPRDFAMQMALIGGCTLQDIGTVFGLTRERVRQITGGVGRGELLPIQVQDDKFLEPPSYVVTNKAQAYVRATSNGTYVYGLIVKDQGYMPRGVASTYDEACDKAGEISNEEINTVAVPAPDQAEN